MSNHIKHYQFLDLIRTVGILQVVLFHILFGVFTYGESDAALALISNLPLWMTFAWQPFGVDAIFLVSSFLLTLALLDERERLGRLDIRAYILKRLLRILPLYYLALLLYQLASPFDLLEFTLTAVFLGVTLGVGNVIPVGWSMEVMMIFFLILPFLLTFVLKSKRPIFALAIFVIIVTGSRIVFLVLSDISVNRLLLDTFQGFPAETAAKQLYYHPWFRLPPFLIGMMLAIIVNKARGSHREISGQATQFFGFFIILVCCFTPVNRENSWIYQLSDTVLVIYFGSLVTLFSFGLALAMWKPLVNNAKWNGSWIRACKIVSRCIFGIYLFHMPFIVLGAIIVLQSVDKMQLTTITPGQIWMIFCVSTLLSLGFAQLLLRFIEAPVIKRFRRFIN